MRNHNDDDDGNEVDFGDDDDDEEDALKVLEGTEVTVVCKSYRGKPAAKVFTMVVMTIDIMMMVLVTVICKVCHPSLPQIKWLDKDGTEIEKNEKKKNIEDKEEKVEGTKLHNAVSTIKLKVSEKDYDLNDRNCSDDHGKD